MTSMLTRRNAACMVLAMPLLARAQAAWKPERTVEFIVPAGAGAALDTAAREMKNLIDRNRLLPDGMLVLNKPGGAGMIAMSALQMKPGDGTLLATLTNSSINNKLIGDVSLGYEDFTPLAILFDEYITVAVRADSPIRNGRDLIARLKTTPSSLSIGIATSIGNHIHVAIAKPLKMGGVDIGKLTIVPFKSSGESMANLLGGHIDVVSASAVNVVPQMKAGNVRVIAVAASERLGGELAAVPTWREQGIDAVYSSSQGVLGTKGLSAAQIGFWEDVFRRLGAMPDWNEFLARNYWKPHFMGHAATLKYLDAENAATRALLGELGLLQK